MSGALVVVVLGLLGCGGDDSPTAPGGDNHLHANIPCAPDQHPASDDCGRIGARPVGCG
jgi:hypothetical protein